MTLKNLLTLFFVIIIWFSFSTKLNAQVHFQNLSYDSAVTLANSQHKKVLISFRADWCKPCLEMERTTLQDSLLGDYVNQRFVAIKFDVDSDTGKKYRNQFGVNEFPSYVIIDSKTTQMLLTLIGYKPARIFMGDLKMLERG